MSDFTLQSNSWNFQPAILEWLGSKRLHKWAVSVTVGLIIGGVILSTVHQSALGAMYLITPGKLHPLWYSSYLPLLFFSSAIYAAMSFAILLAYAAERYFRDRCDKVFLSSVPDVTLSLGKGAAVALYVYFALKVLALAQDDRWSLLFTPFGYWYLVELIGFVALPTVLLYSRGKNSKSGTDAVSGAMGCSRDSVKQSQREPDSLQLEAARTL